MKRFETGGKINFIDENNVFVGYDIEQSCCEHADWFISMKEPNKIEDFKDLDFDNYVFDKTFFKENPLHKDDVDDGGSVLFRLVDHTGGEAFLCLFNSHNGYYGHGFELKIGGQSIKEGLL